MKDFQNVKYIFVITGGGWEYYHDLYVVMKDNSVLYTDEFDTIETAQPEFIFKLDKKLDFEEHTDNIGCDAPDCTMYHVNNGQLQKLYCVGMYDNTPAVSEVLKMKYNILTK